VYRAIAGMFEAPVGFFDSEPSLKAPEPNRFRCKLRLLVRVLGSHEVRGYSADNGTASPALHAALRISSNGWVRHSKSGCLLSSGLR